MKSSPANTADAASSVTSSILAIRGRRWSMALPRLADQLAPVEAPAGLPQPDRRRKAVAGLDLQHLPVQERHEAGGVDALEPPPLPRGDVVHAVERVLPR